MNVTFMVAGVQKGGTTAMYENLRSHPKIGMPRRKEPHFFDNGARNWRAPDYTDLHKLYSVDRAVYGECTPITIFWAASHARIRAYNPEMSFIFLFRDPIERAYSHWCMQFARGRDTLMFDEAIRAGRARVEHKPHVYSYVERGFYAAQLSVMRRTFPNARMLYLMSEDLFNDRMATLTRVAGFIGVDPAGFPSQTIVARTREPISYPSVISEADRAYLRELYASDLELFTCMTGLDIGRWSAHMHAAR